MLLLTGCSGDPPRTAGRTADGGQALPGLILSPEGNLTLPDGNILWDLGPPGSSAGTAIAGAEDSGAEDAGTEGQPGIPATEDPSLAEDALAAAFSLVREEEKPEDLFKAQSLRDVTPPEKSLDVFRIALMLPQEGRASAVSRDIQSGAELAMFKLAPRHVDMVFINTSKNLNGAIAEARDSGADVILGPLFSGNTVEVHRQLRNDSLPVITFSNDTRVAAPGVFLFGQTPEQEIDVALTHALATTTPSRRSGRATPAVAVISDESPYGTRVADQAELVLSRQGRKPALQARLSREILDDEKKLRNEIKELARWTSQTEEGTGRAPPYDIVVLAGDISFSLRVAPVLAWYDINSESIRYVGTSLWSSPAILQEPSLKRGIYADTPESRRRSFSRMWKETGAQTLGNYAPLGFDAVALTAALSEQNPGSFRRRLTDREGFAGFTGTFRFEANGRNRRLLDVLEITGGATEVVAPAQKNF